MSASLDPARAEVHRAGSLAHAHGRASGIADPLPSPSPPTRDTTDGIASLEASLQRLQLQVHDLEMELAGARQALSHQREVEAAMRTLETRLRLVMEAANIGFWDWDAQTNTVYHSPEWKRQLGFEEDELSDSIDEWQTRLHPEDAPRVRAAVAEFMANSGVGYEMEFRLRHRDGTYRWIRSQGRLTMANGKPDRLLGVHVDITAGKERESQLRESEQRFRRLVETTPIVPWEADPDTWRFHYVGPRGPLILGYPLESWLLERFWVDHLHPEDREAAIAFRREQSRRCADFESEYRMLAADGRVIWFHDVVHVAPGAQGSAKLQGFLVDITERKRAAEEHSRLAAIVESSNDAIIGETLDGVITSWNKSAERIYGYSAEEAIGRSVNIFVPRERSHEVVEILARMKRGEIVEHLETLRMRKDGRPIHVSLVVSPIRDGMGAIIGASAIARDITQRKQLEAEVLQISEREQQRIARDLHDGLGQLLSGTVHLCTVLQLELAEQALPEAAEALRITELVNQAVTETRSLARGLYPVNPEPNGLMAALEELTARTKALFHVSCRFHCRKPVLLADNAVATHLYRIAQEAVTNALKHGKARQIGVTLATAAGCVILKIRDNGVGLPETGPTRKGMGIGIMHYRAGMIGGALSIERLTQGGVVVICTVHRPSATAGKPKNP